MIEAGRATPATPKDYGPLQFPNQIGLPVWAFERALRAGLIPPADPVTGRWPAVVVATAVADLDQIRLALGTQPDVGASRAAEVLSARFGIDVDPDVLIEMGRVGLIEEVGDYKGHPMYDGRALEAFDDRDALQRAITAGRLLARDDAARYPRVRRADVEHLVRAHWLEPVTWVQSGWQRRREAPQVPLFRVADLDVLATHPSIDWDEVRATPAGRPSSLAHAGWGTALAVRATAHDHPEPGLAHRAGQRRSAVGSVPVSVAGSVPAGCEAVKA